MSVSLRAVCTGFFLLTQNQFAPLLPAVLLSKAALCKCRVNSELNETEKFNNPSYSGKAFCLSFVHFRHLGWKISIRFGGPAKCRHVCLFDETERQTERQRHHLKGKRRGLFWPHGDMSSAIHSLWKLVVKTIVFFL